MKDIEQKIGIIGCGGFIGSHLLERVLDEKEYSVYGIDVALEKIEHLLSCPNLHFKQIDIKHHDKVEEFLRPCDTIVSLAALCNPALYMKVPLDVIESNFMQPLHLVHYCAKTGKKLIHFSTSEIYGKTVHAIADTLLSDTDDPSNFLLSEDTSPLILGPVSAQRWSYAAAKQLFERVVYAYGAANKLTYTIVRPFNFIGPRMDYIPGIDGEGVPRVFACFMEALLRGKPLKLVDGGRNRRTFTAIDDAIDAVVRILDRPAQSKNQIFNIGNPRNEVTMRELAHLMAAWYKRICPAMSAEPEAVSVTAEEFYGKGYEDSDRRVPDISKARTLLGWEPQIPLDELIRQSMTAYVEYYGRKRAV